MSIANHIIQAICTEENSHMVCARALGCHPDVVEVFNCSGDGTEGAQHVAKFWHPDLSVSDLAVITVAGEVGKRMMECVNLCNYPLARMTMEKSTLPAKGQLLYPTLLVGDGGKFIRQSVQAGSKDHLLFLLQCQDRARDLLKANFAELLYRTKDTIQYALSHKIQDRIPADGVPNDGPHWYFKYPNKPIMDSIYEVVSQWMWIGQQKQN